MICLRSVRVNLGELSSVHSHELEDVELLAVDGELALLAVRNLSYEDCIRPVEFLLSLNEDGSVAIVEEFLLVILDLCIKTVTERHLAYRFSKTAESESISRNDVLCLDLLVDVVPVGLELLYVRHMVRKRSMLDEIEPVALVLEFRRDHLACIDCGDTEGHEHRRHIDVLECSAHRVLSSD